MDYLLDERIRELYDEECRHFVLRRTGKLVERVKKYNNNPLNPGLNIQEHHKLWPIPQDQIDLNVDNKWKQNPELIARVLFPRLIYVSKTGIKQMLFLSGHIYFGGLSKKFLHSEQKKLGVSYTSKIGSE
ncbi:MAG: RagB/SusD family nutrient uptake outer membrane protein [Siphonobacter sp.]